MTSRPKYTESTDYSEILTCIDLLRMMLLDSTLHELQYMKRVSRSFANAARRVMHSEEWMWLARNRGDMVRYIKTTASFALPLCLISIEAGTHDTPAVCNQFKKDQLVWISDNEATATLEKLTVKRCEMTDFHFYFNGSEDRFDVEKQDVNALRVVDARLVVDKVGVFTNPMDVANYKPMCVYDHELYTEEDNEVLLDWAQEHKEHGAYICEPIEDWYDFETACFPYNAVEEKNDMTQGLNSWSAVPEGMSVEYMRNVGLDMPLGDLILNGRVPRGVTVEA